MCGEQRLGPSADAIARAQRDSALRLGPERSGLADSNELRFREEIEPYPDPLQNVPAFIEHKELPRKLRYALERARIRPAGTVVELGAGTCWLAASLANEPAVRRVVAVDFSRRRLEGLAPIAIAHLGAPAAKIERVVADFYNHGLGEAFADFVFTDASFHHATDPIRFARVAFDLLRPGGSVVLFREPSLAVLRRTRDHGIEDQHGAFEREYFPSQYLEHLRAAGFEARKAPAAAGWRRFRTRAILRPPLSWLNGFLFSEYTYIGRKPLR
jgi:SAM-dependent methyltransferase